MQGKEDISGRKLLLKIDMQFSRLAQRLLADKMSAFKCTHSSSVVDIIQALALLLQARNVRKQKHSAPTASDNLLGTFNSYAVMGRHYL